MNHEHPLLDPRKGQPRTQQSAPQHLHIRSDSWRNAFYHSAPPPLPMHPGNVSGQRTIHHEQVSSMVSSMADLADLAVELEGIDVCELGAVPPPPDTSSRRRHSRSAQGPPPRAPSSSPSPAQRKVVGQQENSMAMEPRYSASRHADKEYNPTDLHGNGRDTVTTEFPYQQNNHSHYGSLEQERLQRMPMELTRQPYYDHRAAPSLEQLDDMKAFRTMATPHPNSNGRHDGMHVHDNQQYPFPSSTKTRPLHNVERDYDQPHSAFQSPHHLGRVNEAPSNSPSTPASPESLNQDARTCWCGCWFDVKGWLIRDAKLGPDGLFYFAKWSQWSLAGLARQYFFNPLEPEFTSLQQFNWAIIIGIVMGVYTAVWKFVIDGSVDFVWVKVPSFLLQIGLFTSLDGRFPLYHYMWITPACFGAALSYLHHVMPGLPDQNDWITNLHRRGVQDHATFRALFLISTASMASGLSLGPELPLVLTAGMFGSWLASVCQQSMLQSRVLNLTAAGAAVGGFFGFPMAGALFVLELPHRMGLQYFEALSPATISSIVAVLCNRIITKNEVTGYYKYPFLDATLPSEIFTSAVVYGFYGAAIGTIYVVLVKRCKSVVHWLLHFQGRVEKVSHNELKPLVYETKRSCSETSKLVRGERLGSLNSKNSGLWMAIVGAFTGAIVGWIGVFLPHVMFWGEAQLQSLIDEGRTPLPVFGLVEEPSGGLTARGYCLVNPSDDRATGLGLSCSVAISLAKMLVTGLSLGIGIGGQFWGPLFCGCSAGHFLVHGSQYLSQKYNFPSDFAAHPCVVILCSMGASHVVPFRAHMAIMLILTLTISTFDSESDPNASTAGDYSAVFPLLVVSVFVSLMTTRTTTFYASQTSRGDITAVPEVLCEPGMEGRPLIFEYDGDSQESSYDYPTTDDDMSVGKYQPAPKWDLNVQEMTEDPFQGTINQRQMPSTAQARMSAPPEHEPTSGVASSNTHAMDRLDELLSRPLDSVALVVESSASKLGMSPTSPTIGRARSNSTSSKRGALVRITCYGELHEHHPSLLDQARKGAATADRVETHRRVSSQGSSHNYCSQTSPQTHRRLASDSSASASGVPSIRRNHRSSHDAANASRLAFHSDAVVVSALHAQDIDELFYTHVEQMSEAACTGSTV